MNAPIPPRISAMLSGRAEPRRVYRASSQNDVYDLALTLENTPDSRVSRVAAEIIDEDLMRGPWWFQFLVWVIRRRSSALFRLYVFYEKQPTSARSLIYDTSRHMRNGSDREEATSCGGFSQREMNIMVGILGVAS